MVDDELRKLGVKRQVMVSAPHFLSGCQLCSVTNHIITLPRFLAEQVAKGFNLSLHELPFKMAGFTIGMHWHSRLENDPEHLVIRQLVERVIKEQYHSVS